MLGQPSLGGTNSTDTSRISKIYTSFHKDRKKREHWETWQHNRLSGALLYNDSTTFSCRPGFSHRSLQTNREENHIHKLKCEEKEMCRCEREEHLLRYMTGSNTHTDSVTASICCLRENKLGNISEWNHFQCIPVLATPSPVLIFLKVSLRLHQWML